MEGIGIFQYIRKEGTYPAADRGSRGERASSLPCFVSKAAIETTEGGETKVLGQSGASVAQSHQIPNLTRLLIPFPWLTYTHPVCRTMPLPPTHLPTGPILCPMTRYMTNPHRHTHPPQEKATPPSNLDLATSTSRVRHRRKVDWSRISQVSALDMDVGPSHRLPLPGAVHSHPR